MLLGDNPDPKLVESLSNELQVTAQTPPTFLFHTTTDATVPVENSVHVLHGAAQGGCAGRDAHLRARSARRGLAQTDEALSTWPARLADWLRVRGLLNAAASCGHR
jgi:hypothetical protein